MAVSRRGAAQAAINVGPGIGRQAVLQGRAKWCEPNLVVTQLNVALAKTQRDA